MTRAVPVQTQRAAATTACSTRGAGGRAIRRRELGCGATRPEAAPRQRGRSARGIGARWRAPRRSSSLGTMRRASAARRRLCQTGSCRSGRLCRARQPSAAALTLAARTGRVRGRRLIGCVRRRRRRPACGLCEQTDAARTPIGTAHVQCRRWRSGRGARGGGRVPRGAAMALRSKLGMHQRGLESARRAGRRSATQGPSESARENPPPAHLLSGGPQGAEVDPPLLGVSVSGAANRFVVIAYTFRVEKVLGVAAHSIVSFFFPRTKSAAAARGERFRSCKSISRDRGSRARRNGAGCRGPIRSFEIEQLV